MKKDTGPDITEIVIKMQEQLNALDKKIDVLIGQTQAKPQFAHPPKQFQRFDRPQHQGDRRPDNNNRERILHKAICADCNKECEVPFRPSQDRPVYCKDCFSKRKGGSSFKGNADNRPHQDRSFHAEHPDKSHREEKKRSPHKKRPAVKRRKARG
jgi:CxxC-x17-CxxC domain-containing protein